MNIKLHILGDNIVELEIIDDDDSDSNDCINIKQYIETINYDILKKKVSWGELIKYILLPL